MRISDWSSDVCSSDLNGKLTDHHGKTVDFRNVILIMTTNAGASDMAREGIGFGSTTRVGEDEEAIKRMFTPEFRNRLDAIVPFSYLPPAVVARENGRASCRETVCQDG